MRIAVVGGSGFIGRPLVRRLTAAGHDVAVLHRGKTAAELPPGTVAIRCDRADVERARSALARFAPDAVVDLIAYTEADARRLIASTDSLATRLVVISSGDVYRAYDRLQRRETGATERIPLGEDARLRARPYPYRGPSPRPADAPDRWLDDYEKIHVERWVRAQHPGATILRLPMVYGPGDRQHRFLDVAQRIRDGRPGIPIEEALAGWRTSFGFVDNVVEAIALAATAERAVGQVFNVAEPHAPTWIEWARDFAAVAGFGGRVARVPTASAPPHLCRMRDALALEQHLVLDTAHIRATLGYAEPVPRDDCLRRTLEWELGSASDEMARTLFDYPAEDAVLKSERVVP